jgi:hypothetical protein
MVTVETADDYPQRRRALFARSDPATWTMARSDSEQPSSLFDTFVQNAVVKTYRTLGTVGSVRARTQQNRAVCNRRQPTLHGDG